MLLQKPQEVSVFADEHSARGSCRHEDLVVGGVPQLKITNRSALNEKGGGEPGSQRRRELSVEPEVHAATIG